MKMLPADFKKLKDTITPFNTENRRASYRREHFGLLRYQWDLLRLAGMMPFVCDTLYKYLDDTHIQTALNKIIPTLED